MYWSFVFAKVRNYFYIIVSLSILQKIKYFFFFAVRRKEADGKKYIKYEVIGSHDVAVPTHFFKVVVLETSDRKLLLEAYVMPNEPIDDNVPLSSFQVVKKIIFFTKFGFFCFLLLRKRKL